MSFSARATSGGMPLHDVQLIKGAIRQLKSSRLETLNGVFQFPFDVNTLPGYLEVCPTPMDLQTLEYNLDNGDYANLDEFFDDLFLIFQNAINYHSDKDQTVWIAKAAKKMMKEAKNQESKVRKKSAAATVAEPPPAPTGPSGNDGSGGMSKIKIKLPTGSKSSTNKIKVKAPGSASRGKTPPPGASAPSTVPSSAPSSSSSSAAKPPATDDKVKLKKPIKINLKAKVKKEPMADKPVTTKPKGKGTGAAGDAPKKTSAKKAAGTSPGKQLPKGVAATAAPVPAPAPTASMSSVASPPVPSTTVAQGTTGTTVKKAGKKKSPAKAVASSATAQPGGAIGGKATGGKASGGKASTTKITIKTEKMSSKSKSHSTANSRIIGNTNMTPTRKAQCWKVIHGLKRRQAKNIGWFIHAPTKDKMIKKDYNAKIKHPMDISTIQSKLDSDHYRTVGEFVLDVRRIFGNCLRFNITVEKDSLRPVAVDTLGTAEELMTYFLGKPEYPQQAYPPLVFCWRLCLQTLDTLFNIKNPGEEFPTAYFFLYPVSFYYGGQFPQDYKKIVPKPMDFSTIQGKLVEGQYEDLKQFEDDCHLIFSNCIAYNQGNEEGICQQARRLEEALNEQMTRLNRYVSSSAGQAASARLLSSVTTATLPKPPISLLLDIVSELRQQTYIDKATQIKEPAMKHFEKPVSYAVNTDYMSYVRNPMDLQTVERKTKNSQYETPEDFEYDMLLIFQNAIIYNTAKKVDHLVALAKFGRSSFAKIFKSKMKQLDDPSSLSAAGVIRKDPPIDSSGQGPSKKMKLDSSRPLPRITIKATTITEAQKLSEGKTPKEGETNQPKPNPSSQPVPLHIAIARVKEQFPLRRTVKNLQGWESACLRFYKEMMKHPWLSIARPQFIFHVPVSDLYPTLREVYAMKIQRPMDLTTVECTLLAGNRYAAPEDFINDIALVFVNAIRFNKEGKDIGDPLSCAYYDASIHLLNYTRWLSLEALPEYVQPNDHVDEPEDEGLPVTSWKLTMGNQQKARTETSTIVLNEHIDKSNEGDTYTWTESECEKLLKSLRHRGDEKYMRWYVEQNFPIGYSNVIETPMAWVRVQKKLRKRQYDKFGDLIGDLRLIFSNAMKYNAPHANQDPASKAAYEGAKHMSAKLEATITKSMVSIADKIKREQIDNANAEREMAAQERAEEEAMRAQWSSSGARDGDDTGSSSAPTRIEASQRIQQSKIRRIVIRRRSGADFDIPDFNEEGAGQHERSYMEVMKRQKATFERQQGEMKQMRKIAAGVGQSLFGSMQMHQLALEWVRSEQEKLGMNADRDPPKKSEKEDETAKNPNNASSLSQDLVDAKNRNPIKMKLSAPKKKQIGLKRKANQSLAKTKASPAAFSWDDDEDDDE